MIFKKKNSTSKPESDSKKDSRDRMSHRKKGKGIVKKIFAIFAVVAILNVLISKFSKKGV